MTDYKSSYYIPSTVVSAFFLLSYLILTKTKGILILHEKKKAESKGRWVQESFSNLFRAILSWVSEREGSGFQSLCLELCTSCLAKNVFASGCLGTSLTSSYSITVFISLSLGHRDCSQQSWWSQVRKNGHGEENGQSRFMQTIFHCLVVLG